jgi:hypothetical protein
VSLKTKIKEMKMNRIFFIALLGIGLLTSCGKPNDPEILPDISGGYKVVQHIPTAGYALDIIKKGNLLHVVQGEGGLLIVDIADIENPEVVSITTQDVRGYSVKIALKDTVVYLAAGAYGVTVLDISDPYFPIVTASNVNMKPARNLHIMGNYIFTAVSEQGVMIADISYPTQPDIRGDIITSGYAYGITTSADSNYLMAASGEMGFSMYDISDFQEGFGIYRQVGWCDTPGYAEEITIIDDQSIAFLACGTSGLQIVNYADTNNVYIAGSYDGGGYTKSLKYRDNRVYLASELAGLQIVDVTDVTHPKLIGVVETSYAMGLEIDDDYVYVADEEAGIIIVSIPD